MKLTLRIAGEPEQWLVTKDRWTRADLRRWAAALPDEPGQELEDRLRRRDEARLAILCEWVTACHIEDVEGNVYTSLDDVTPEVLDRLDMPIYQLLVNLPSEASAQRGRLGEVTSGASSTR